MNQCHYIRRTINDFPSVILKVSEICKNSSNVVLIEHSLQRQFSNTFIFTEMFVLIWSLLKMARQYIINITSKKIIDTSISLRSSFKKPIIFKIVIIKVQYLSTRVLNLQM